MAMERVILAVIISSTLISMASAIDGTATFNTIYVPSSCYGYSDQGTMIVAADPGLFNSKAACGKTCTVRCTGGTNQGTPQPCLDGEVTVTIVDLCRECAANQLDLSLEAFSAIANPDAGKITVEYNCD